MNGSVFHSTPFKDGDIGGGLNDFIDLLPDNAWVCLRDADTLFLTPDAPRQVAQIARSDPPFDVIGCVTNRLRAPYQLHNGKLSDNPDIRDHIQIAAQREKEHWCELKPISAPVAGMFLLFRKNTWQRLGGFEPRCITFDVKFSQRLLAAGGKIAIATGLYLFHLYRFGEPDPTNAVSHLIQQSS